MNWIPGRAFRLKAQSQVGVAATYCFIQLRGLDWDNFLERLLVILEQRDDLLQILFVRKRDSILHFFRGTKGGEVLIKGQAQQRIEQDRHHHQREDGATVAQNLSE